MTRSKEEAIEILKQHQKELLEAPDLQVAFAELAKTESDCSSARSQGDLGTFFMRGCIAAKGTQELTLVLRDF